MESAHHMMDQLLGTAGTEIASKFVEAAERYSENPVALNLGAMNMLYESIVKKGSLMVVPSALADSLNAPGIMGMAGAAGLRPEDAEEPPLVKAARAAARGNSSEE